MPIFADVYVLVPHRAPATARAVLAELGPAFQASSEDVTDVEAVLRHFADNTHDPGDGFGYYFRSTIFPHRQANIHYTPRGGMVLGLAVPLGSSELAALEKLKSITGSAVGMILVECPPPVDDEEFAQVAGRWSEEGYQAALRS